jgi:4-alpha-glucanotransferase
MTSLKGFLMDLFPRSSGVLLHPTSLPGRYGIGDLGETAYTFIDWLVEAKQTVWQVLPLGPTGYGDSPYQTHSAFAGNAVLISLRKRNSVPQ